MAEPIPTNLILINGLAFCRSILLGIQGTTGKEAERVSEVDQPDYKDPDNITRRIDHLSEELGRTIFTRAFEDALETYGEEGRPLPPDIARHKKTILLIDPIDGTDLLARGLSNWCSALTFFYPSGTAKIIAAFVAHASGCVYFATDKGAFVEFPPRTTGYRRGRRLAYTRTRRRRQVRLKIRNGVARLDDAAVCFYGQKPANLLSVINSAPFKAGMVGLAEKVKGAKAQKAMDVEVRVPKFRFYNLGGNPMLAKIADQSVDAVFELIGQEPHDVIPGAFVAQKSGAVIEDLEGQPLQLMESLLNPEKRLTYIAAASKSLADELRQICTQSGSH